MEAISARKDEKPDSKAANLDLPGDSALEVEGTSGQCPEGAVAFPDLFPPLAESPLGPFVVKRTYAKPAGVPISSCVRREGGTVRAGKLFTALSRDTFQTHRMRIKF